MLKNAARMLEECGENARRMLPQDAEEAEDEELFELEELEETIEIRHGPEGTEFIIEDVTVLELAALVILAVAISMGLRAAYRDGKRRRRR